MRKKDVIRDVAIDTGKPRADVERIIDSFIVYITEALVDEDRYEHRGFGVFTVKQRAARTGRNPSTGEAMEIPAQRVVLFRAAPALKKAVA